MAQSTVSIGSNDGATGVIGRTNAGLVGAAREAARDEKRIEVFGGVEGLTLTLEAADQLFQGKPTRHEVFSTFGSWKDLSSAVQKAASAREFRPIVQLVDEYNDEIPQVCAGISRVTDYDRRRLRCLNQIATSSVGTLGSA
jgi:hypothetical protein